MGTTSTSMATVFQVPYRRRVHRRERPRVAMTARTRSPSIDATRVLTTAESQSGFSSDRRSLRIRVAVYEAQWSPAPAATNQSNAPGEADTAHRPADKAHTATGDQTRRHHPNRSNQTWSTNAPPANSDSSTPAAAPTATSTADASAPADHAPTATNPSPTPTSTPDNQPHNQQLSHYFQGK
jgi:hypothetical protein